ncbi:MAG: hypothetical protein IMF12_11285, partial [Proteobacteria bacterium]|nr:hypothetical protein [Pseudomonadota bacterium]
MTIFPQNKVLRWLIWLIFLFGLVVISITTAFTKLPNYKAKIEYRISSIIKQPVTIKLIKTYWTYGSPTIALKQLHLLDNEKNLITTANIEVIINLWQSLLQWQV